MLSLGLAELHIRTTRLLLTTEQSIQEQKNQTKAVIFGAQPPRTGVTLMMQGVHLGLEVRTTSCVIALKIYKIEATMILLALTPVETQVTRYKSPQIYLSVLNRIYRSYDNPTDMGTNIPQRSNIYQTFLLNDLQTSCNSKRKSVTLRSRSQSMRL